MTAVRAIAMLVCGTLCAQPAVALAQTAQPPSRVAVPSGQTVAHFDTRIEADTQTYRFRFWAPDIASPLTRPSFSALSADLEALCAEFAVKNIAQDAAPNAMIVVSMSAEQIEFGTSAPDVEQVFEAFRIRDGACILEPF